MQPLNKVTIIIATYNRAHLIAETLDSIKNQTTSPFQIIIVDDGSCDSTEEVIKSFPLDIDYLKKTNGGKASAINHATNFIKGDSIIIFDDDDLLSPTSIAAHLETFKKHPNIDFTYSQNYIGIHKQGQPLAVSGTDYLEGIDHQNLFISTLNQCQTLMQGMLIRREAFEGSLPFNERLTRSQDYEFMLRLMQKYSGQFINSPTFTLREHSGPRGSHDNNFSSDKKMIKWLEFDRIILISLFDNIKREFSESKISSSTLRPENIYLLLFCAYAGRALWNESIFFLKKISFNATNFSGTEKTLIHKAMRKSTLDWITKSNSEKLSFIKALILMPNPIKVEVIRALLWKSGGRLPLFKKLLLQ